jgi:hypothetical protein
MNIYEDVTNLVNIWTTRVELGTVVLTESQLFSAQLLALQTVVQAEIWNTLKHIWRRSSWEMSCQYLGLLSVSGLCPSCNILKEHKVSETGSVLV